MSPTRVDAAMRRPAATKRRRIGRATTLFVVAILFALAGCSGQTSPSVPPSDTAPATAPPSAKTQPETDPGQRELASDPARMADDLVADEQALRDQSSPEAVLAAAARRQQEAYRAIATHPEWDPIVRPRIPQPLLEAYDRNVDARRQLEAMSKGAAKDTLPAWNIVAPPPADELMSHYRKAEAEFGVGWSYLAAINLVETAFGRVDGVSTAGAQGPMQFLPSTFAAFGDGGDIQSPHDSVMAAGRYLASNGFAENPEYALYRYNNSNQYVQAVTHYAEVMAADPAAFAGYYRWDVYYRTTAGDVVLPVGYSETSPLPVDAYLAAQPR